MRAWRINATPGGMQSIAATTPEEAGNDVARALAKGARSVEVEEFEAKGAEDIGDAWGCLRHFEKAERMKVPRG